MYPTMPENKRGRPYSSVPGKLIWLAKSLILGTEEVLDNVENCWFIVTRGDLDSGVES